MFNRPENGLVQKWCEMAAANGGTFSVRQEFSGAQWWTHYTIEWPDCLRVPDMGAA
ncbi:hypothetical protein CBM2637_A150015 [Cupriavidus taiwanensis]|uniref:hypothetical protein n=1 Tax=Cupriavidus taiwanensis TaxID=164546 RepID=UPI000E14C9EF|nr:hypothetical protein [Cupriavidus taiwanensis]SPA24562.1 hypothetical protein CBM2637_A150015 [Cupriavidus taiwanensis]